MERVGEEVIDDIETELILKKKFILTESGKFKACKCNGLIICSTLLINISSC